MAQIPGTVAQSGILAPLDSADKYAVGDEKYLKIFFKGYATLTERNQEFEARRKDNMHCFVSANGKYYRLINNPVSVDKTTVTSDSDWAEITFGSGSTGTQLISRSAMIALRDGVGYEKGWYLITDALAFDTGGGTFTYSPIIVFTDTDTTFCNAYNTVSQEPGFYGLDNGVAGVDTWMKYVKAITLTVVELQARAAASAIEPDERYRLTDAVGNTKVLIVYGDTSTTITELAENLTNKNRGTYVLATDTYTADAGGGGGPAVALYTRVVTTSSSPVITRANLDTVTNAGIIIITGSNANAVDISTGVTWQTGDFLRLKNTSSSASISITGKTFDGSGPSILPPNTSIDGVYDDILDTFSIL